MPWVAPRRPAPAHATEPHASSHCGRGLASTSDPDGTPPRRAPKQARPRGKRDGGAGTTLPPVEGSQRLGTVTTVAFFGAFVRLDGWDRDALLHVSEISDDYVEDPEGYVKPGQRVQVLVEKVETRAGGLIDVHVSMKPSKVRLTVRADLDPLTLVVFDLPHAMDEGEVEELCGKYGLIAEVTLLPSLTQRKVPGARGLMKLDETSRRLTLVTFACQEEGRACLRELHRSWVPSRVGLAPHKIGVKVWKKQDFKQRLQDQWDREFKKRQDDTDPMKRHIRREANKLLREIIPYAFDHEGNLAPGGALF